MKRRQLQPDHGEKGLIRTRGKSLKSLLTGVLLACSAVALAAIELNQLSTPELSARYKKLIQDYRCPKCQNQNLADSDSPISVDLRREIRRMLVEGRSDKEISDFLVERYGEFVLYRPRLKSSTYLLWLGPLLLLLCGSAVVVLVIRRQASSVRVNSADAGSQLALDPREEARLRELLNETATQDADCRDKDTRSDRSAAPR